MLKESKQSQAFAQTSRRDFLKISGTGDGTSGRCQRNWSFQLAG